MAQRFRRSMVTAALLATALSLAGPVEAGSRFLASGPEGFLDRALSWVEAAWELVMPGGQEGHERSRVRENGASPTREEITPPKTTCTVNCDKGGGVDPNG